MKKSLICGLAMAIVTLPAAFAGNNNPSTSHPIAAEANWGLKKLTGSGKIIEKETTISKYSQIAVCRAVNVIIEDRTDNKVVIKADDNVMEYVVCKVENGKLTAKISDEIGSLTNINVSIYLPMKGNIKKISTSSAGNVTIYPTIKGSSLGIAAASAGNVKISHAEVETLDIEVSSAGNISGTYIAKTAEIDASSAGTVDITLTAIEAECDASSSANIILAGSAEKLEADASSAGDIRAKKFVAEVVDAEASSGADIYIQATKRIDARASSGGDICYTGDATNINRSTSSGGSVKKK